MDTQVGQILDTLKESGAADDTVVLFTSEQGSQFPGCKWTNWDTGLHTALVAKWPGQIEADIRTDAIVQYADVLPTLIEIAGGNPASTGNVLDGTSFQAVLRGEADTHRKYAYGIHNNIPEGPSYPIRSISNGDVRYIRNLRPNEIYIEKHLMGMRGNGRLNNPYWATWVRDAWNNRRTYDLVKRYTRRPPEQLYVTADDPYELNDLAGDPSHAAVSEELSRELDRWMSSQGDPGAPVDTHDAIEAAKDQQHQFSPNALSVD